MLWWKRRKALLLIESFVDAREERYACLEDKDYIGAEWAWEFEETVYLEMCDLLGVETSG